MIDLSISVLTVVSGFFGISFFGKIFQKSDVDEFPYCGRVGISGNFLE